jgi:uncharacterized coiled-coil protein SlyX
MATAPSSEALAAIKQVALLEQRLESLERRDGIQDEVIKDQSAALNKIEGAEDARVKASNSNSKYIGPVVTGVFFVLSLGVGGGIYGKMNQLSDQVSTLTTDLAVAGKQIAFLEAKKSPDLSEIESNQAKFDTRIATIEANLVVRDSNNVRRDATLTQQGKDIFLNEAKLAAVEQRVSANAADIAGLQEQSTRTQRNLAKVAASLNSGFTEIESQLRGFNALVATAFGAQFTPLAVLWEKVMGQKLPDQQPLPMNIPATAYTSIGGVTID